MNKQKWHIHTRNEGLTHATTGMNLESMMGSKTSQSQKTTYCKHLYEIFRIGKNRDVEGQLVFGGVWGRGESGGTGFLLGIMKMCVMVS